MAEIILLLVIFAAGSLLYSSFKTGISPMPTSSRERKALFELLPETVEGTILDLGSGWGNLAFPLARKYPNCRVIGYEVSLIPWATCWTKQKIFGPRNLNFKRADFLQEPLPPAVLVVLFLFPEAMKQLAPLLKKSLPKGAIILSNSFAMPGWEPDLVKEIGNLVGSKIYFYIV